MKNSRAHTMKNSQNIYDEKFPDICNEKLPGTYNKKFPSTCNEKFPGTYDSLHIALNKETLKIQTKIH